jgi:KUP system potassium uptake protein
LLLMLGTIGLVLGFRSSSDIAGAYGIAVSITMVVTTLLAYYLTRRRWRWSMVWALLVVGPLLAVDLAFLGANALKIFNGGWFSLLVGGAIYLLMSTWVRGRDMVQSQHELDAVPVDQFLALVRQEQPSRVPGTALFLTSVANAVPPTLLHHLRRNRVLHQLVVLVTMTTERVPFVSSVLRLRVEHAGDGVWHLYVHYGFMETPNIPNAIAIAEELGLIPGLREQEATYYLGHTIVVPSRRLPGMAQWRERLFAFLARNAMNATAFYRIPAERMVELGMRIDM